MTKPLFVSKQFKPQEFKPHFHKHYSIGLITNGEQKLHINSNRLLIKKGEIRVINPNELHFVDKESEWGYANIIVSKEDILEIASQVYKKDFKDTIYFKNCIDEKRVLEKFITLYNNLSNTLNYEENYIEFIELLLQDFSIYGGAKQESFGNIHKVLEYIEANFLDDIGLEDLALVAGVSKYHIIKLFKAKLSLTPHQYIMRLRVNEAVKLIAKDMPLSLVAMHCGFSDQSHFIKEFKAIYGFTPSKLKIT